MDQGAEGDAFYRSFIDRLVEQCRNGLYERKLATGVWNLNATTEIVPEDHRVNLLLADLSPEQRHDLARILTEAHVTGVFDVLVALYEESVPPFDKGYEGDPFNDFMGRMTGWEWPEGDERWG